MARFRDGENGDVFSEKSLLEGLGPLKTNGQTGKIKFSLSGAESGLTVTALLVENGDVIDVLLTRFFSLTYTWKQEYLGPRTVDGYKYLVTLDINHKRKTYKIQNKYPDNWEEFINLKDSLINGGYLK